jgi:PAS domain S-box-containing protein
MNWLRNKPALRISLIYLVVSILWITLSDQIVEALTANERQLSLLQTYKGLLFVAASTLLIFWMMHREIKQREIIQRSLSLTEKRFRTTFEQASIGMAHLDLDGNYLRVNPALCAILGYTEAELLQTNYADITHPDDLPADRARTQPIIDGEIEVFTRDKRYIHKDGTPVWCYVTSTVVNEAPDSPRYFLAFVEDISERKRAEANLKNTADQLHALIDHMPVMIDAFDAEYRILLWNQECERVTGYSRDEIVGQPNPLEILYPDRKYREKMMTELAQRGNNFHNWRWTLTTRDGQQRTVEWSNIAELVPLLGWTSWAVGLDITDRLEAEKRLQDNEARYRELLNKAPIPILVHSEYKIVFINQMAVKVLGGTTPDDFLGMDALDVIPPANQDHITNRIEKTYAKIANTPVMEERFIRLDGEIINTEVSATPVDYEGKPASQVVFQDITERRHAADALEHYATRLAIMHEIDRAILAANSIEDIAQSALPYLLQIVDCDHVNLITVDLAQATGRVRAVHTVNAPSKLTPNTTYTLTKVFSQRNLYAGKILYHPSITITSDTSTAGQAIYEDGIRSYASVPMLVQGSLIGTLNFGSYQPDGLSLRDLEDAREVADQLAIAVQQWSLYAEVQRYATELEQRVDDRTRQVTDAYERLKELDTLKSKFVSDVSHELRAPIQNFTMYLNLLERQIDDADRRARYLDILNIQAGRLRQLIESILDISRLERNRDQVAYTPTNLNELVEQIAINHRARAEAAGLALEVRLEASLPPVKGDGNQLKQVIANLLTNAINYTQDGEVSITTGQTNTDLALLIVRDTGAGIHPDDLPHLFERFYRGQQPDGQEIPGTGLGLGIVKEIVDQHGGHISVESELGKGSTFTIYLPLA